MTQLQMFEILYLKNNVLCLIKVNSNAIELTVNSSGYCVLDLLLVKNLLFATPNYLHFATFFQNPKDMNRKKAVQQS